MGLGQTLISFNLRKYLLYKKNSFSKSIDPDYLKTVISLQLLSKKTLVKV